ncbi:MAG: glycosyltransferase family 4 protein [Chloroflexi bacterium]|nr:glycosyltransferase family 4 protein [Chloroflexota bacterium]
MTKLVYVLPVYDEYSSEHFYHLYGFLDKLSKRGDILIFIERCVNPPQFPAGARVYYRRTHWPVMSLLETFLVLLSARLRGYNRFYVHYSLSAAFLCGVLTRLTGGISYYWHCGHPTEFLPKCVRSLEDIKCWLRNGPLLSWTLRIVHYLVTGSPKMARYYSQVYGVSLERIRVMPNWVDLDRFSGLPSKEALRTELRLPQNVPMVLFLHRLVERKGAHYLVPIARLVTEKRRMLFLIAGDGPYRARLEVEIKDAGLEGSFRLIGWVPNREVMRYFGAADVYIMPSEEEGFPRTLLEAMAAGCPFVATDVGGVRDVVTPSQRKFVVPKGEPVLFAEALDCLLDDETLRRHLAVDGMTRVQDFSQERVVEIFLDLLGGQEAALHADIWAESNNANVAPS